MSQAVYVTVKSSSIIVEAPFRQSFLDELKERIPARDREWDGENKSWIIKNSSRSLDMGYEKSIIRELIKNHFKDYKAYLIQGATIIDLHTGELFG